MALENSGSENCADTVASAEGIKDFWFIVQENTLGLNDFYDVRSWKSQLPRGFINSRPLVFVGVKHLYASGGIQYQYPV